ncbi:hypothetical protein AVEN_208895-1 [Araneus ventricosus]|uniref:Uncharacterized protein n=1 Tax=Araneus ventricosus TaxID=182803 RepID=A0A4Y2F3S3_ARAVE|nr:hypothetical protein AVEN_208895-1 [Araneus ventricosus]
MDWMFGIPNNLKSDWDGLLRPRCEKTKLLPRLGTRGKASKLGNSPFGVGCCPRLHSGEVSAPLEIRCVCGPGAVKYDVDKTFPIVCCGSL